MKNRRLKPLAFTLLSIVGTASSTAVPAAADSIFSTEEILDESTLETKILQDWHTDTVTGTTRQKLVEINVIQSAGLLA